MAASVEAPRDEASSAPIIYPQRGEGNFVLAIILSIIVTVVLLLRFWSRALLAEKRFGADDWTALLTWPFVVGLNVASAILLRHGFGTRIAEVRANAPGDLMFGMKVLYALYICYNTSSDVSRISAILFYDRLFSTTSSRFRWWVCLSVALNVAWLVAINCLSIFECTPIRAFWDKSVPGYRCLPPSHIQLTAGITRVLLDLLTLVLPVPILWKLHLPTNRKILVLGVFVLGYSVLIMTIGRLITVTKSGPALNSDITWSLIDEMAWLILGSSVASICISLPSTFTLIRRWRKDGVRALFSRGDRSTYVQEYHPTKYNRMGSESSQRTLKNLTSSAVSKGTDIHISHEVVESSTMEMGKINVVTDIEVGSVRGN